MEHIIVLYSIIITMNKTGILVCLRFPGFS